jgi:hypothetical protein
MRGKQLIRNVDGVVIGYIRGKDFVKKVHQSVHRLQQPEGWASDVKALEDAKHYGATRIVLTEVETQRVFSAPIDRLFEEGVKLNRGHGDQLVLPSKRWTVRDQRQPRLLGEQ